MGDQGHEVTIVKYGTRVGERSEVFLNYRITGDDDAEIRMDYFFWVVRTGERVLLVDTGFSRAGGEARDRTFLVDPADAFAALGVDTRAHIDIVVTHAHYDHIGNLEMFPNANVIIAAQEIDFWASPMRSRAQFAHSVEEHEIQALLTADAEGRVTRFDERMVVAGGIEVRRIGGHTPGQSIVLVETNEGTVLLASDAVHYYEELEDDLPFAFVADLPAMYDGFDTVNDLLASEASHLVSGHDPSTLERFGIRGEGVLAGLTATIGTRQRGADTK